MANNIAFQPMGKTASVTTANTVTNIQVNADSPVNQYLLSNQSGAPAYVWISPAGSPVNVAIPTGGGVNAAYGVTVLANTSIVITGPQCSASANVQVSAISTSGTPTVSITPGEGLR